MGVGPKQPEQQAVERISAAAGGTGSPHIGLTVLVTGMKLAGICTVLSSEVSSGASSSHRRSPAQGGKQGVSWVKGRFV